jgi:hypothetical protein
MGEGEQWLRCAAAVRMKAPGVSANKISRGYPCITLGCEREDSWSDSQRQGVLELG